MFVVNTIADKNDKVKLYSNIETLIKKYLESSDFSTRVILDSQKAKLAELTKKKELVSNKIRKVDAEISKLKVGIDEEISQIRQLISELKMQLIA